MSLRDELDLDILARKQSSKVDQILAGTLEAARPLDSGELLEFEEVLGDRTVSSGAIARLLGKRGYAITRSSVQKYRQDQYGSTQ